MYYSKQSAGTYPRTKGAHYDLLLVFIVFFFTVYDVIVQYWCPADRTWPCWIQAGFLLTWSDLEPTVGGRPLWPDLRIFSSRYPCWMPSTYYCLWTLTLATAWACRPILSGTYLATTWTTPWVVTMMTTTTWLGSAGWSASFGTNFWTSPRDDGAWTRHLVTGVRVNRPGNRYRATWTATTGRPPTWNRCALAWWHRTKPTSRMPCRWNTRTRVCSGSIYKCCNHFS